MRSTEIDMTTELVTVLATYQCPRDACHRPSLVAVEFYFGLGDAWSHKVVGQLPRGTAQRMEGLPPEIESGRVEAWQDYCGITPNSTLSRRCGSWPGAVKACD
jgi:hypothetical protein